jgi:hypothetical protein
MTGSTKLRIDDKKTVSPNSQLLSRRDRHLPANSSDVDIHRDSISSRFDCRGANARPAMRGQMSGSRVRPTHAVHFAAALPMGPAPGADKFKFKLWTRT